MTISLPENKVILMKVNNYSRGEASYLKWSSSSENFPSPTSTSVAVFIPGTPLPHHGDTGLLCVPVAEV